MNLKALLEIEPERPYEFVEGRYGPRMVLTSPWGEEARRAFRERGAVELELNYAKGWPDRSLALLRDVPDLLALDVLDWRLEDVVPIEGLADLRSLRLSTYGKGRLDFARLPRLERCFLEWTSGVRGVFGAAGLVSLFVNRLPKPYVPKVASLPRLRELRVYSCGAESLDVVAGLPELEWLDIALFPRLQGNGFLRGLPRLKKLRVTACRGFGSLEPLRDLPDLEEVTLNNLGPVESLEPLRGRPRLRRLILMGRTWLADPTPLPEADVARLEKLAMPTYPHPIA